ncbi:MAG: hypothetical protein HY720_09920 [Planctomycetes bacterium]|nr:hypothetical protein [Planctomycetota bacterium]
MESPPTPAGDQRVPAAVPPARVRVRWKRILLPFVFLWIALAGLLFVGGCADDFILFPSTNPYAVEGQTRRIVECEGKDLEIWIWRSHAEGTEEPHAYVLEFIGNADRAEWAGRVPHWKGIAIPIEVWRVNYPGYGGSTGPAALDSIAPAALAAFDDLARVAGSRPIFASGISLGGTAALAVGAERDVAGVVLRNPPPLFELILGAHGWWNLWLPALAVACQIPAKLDSVENAARSRSPALFFMAEKDEVIPPEYQQKIQEAYAGEKRVVEMPGADHNEPLSPEAKAELHRWLEDRVRTQR